MANIFLFGQFFVRELEKILSERFSERDRKKEFFGEIQVNT